MKNVADFHYYLKEAITCIHQTTLFIVSKHEWDTKEDTVTVEVNEM